MVTRFWNWGNMRDFPFFRKFFNSNGDVEKCCYGFSDTESCFFKHMSRDVVTTTGFRSIKSLADPGVLR